MKTYYIKNTAGQQFKIQAQTVNDLKEKMIAKCPNGKYSVKDESGKALNSITLNHYSRPVLPKADYDNLYFYVTARGQERINDGECTPQDISSPRRYNTINDVRKSALAKSFANYRRGAQLKEAGMERYITPDESVLLYIYKGSNILGMVDCSPFAKPPYKGTGIYTEYVRPAGGRFVIGREYRLLKDGSIVKMD